MASIPLSLFTRPPAIYSLLHGPVGGSSQEAVNGRWAREKTQRYGRHAALQRDAEPAHAHAEGGGHRRGGLRRRVQLRGFPAPSASPAALAGPVALQARRDPLAVTSPDVAGELRGRPGLPPPA